VTHAEAPTEFFSRTFDETLALLVEARNYVDGGGRADSADLPLGDRLRFALESMRVTSRLSQVMAWLLTQKAVHAGEIPRTETAKSEHRLSGRSICLDDRAELSAGLPPRLCELLDQSHRLYVRVARLDEMVRRAN